MGYKITRADGITGFYTVIDTGRVGPTVLVLAELDSLINFKHPECDKTTGAIHNCGHNAQCAAMLCVTGAHPHKGINVFNAANLILLAINSLRETFQEKDYV